MKNKILKGSKQQNDFSVQTSFHHDEQHGFIRSVENVILMLPMVIYNSNGISTDGGTLLLSHWGVQ